MSKQIIAGLALLILFCLGTGGLPPRGQAQTGRGRHGPKRGHHLDYRRRC